MSPLSPEKAEELVHTILVDALQVEPEDVCDEAVLARDLVSDSTDVLDITFRLQANIANQINVENLSLEQHRLIRDTLLSEGQTVKNLIDAVIQISEESPQAAE